MATVLSESSSTSASPRDTTRYRLAGRKRDAMFAFGDQPQAQVKLNRLVADAFHGDSSVELRNAELTRAAARALQSFGMNQAKGEPRRSVSHTDKDESRSSVHDDAWGNIQDYGEFLRDTADTVQMIALMSPLTEPGVHTSPQDLTRAPQTNHISPFDWLTWRDFRFKEEFRHLAPLTVGENRMHAQQSARLIDWVMDASNHAQFSGWGGLDQLASASPPSEEERQQREIIEREALKEILDGDLQRPAPRTGELGWKLDSDGTIGRSVFAEYLSQEYPEIKGGDIGVTKVDVSEEHSMDGSDVDTRTVVSNDNHWRRTMLG
jgi:hypothetical protein